MHKLRSKMWEESEYKFGRFEPGQFRKEKGASHFISRKKYVLVPGKEYNTLQIPAAKKTELLRKLSRVAGKKHALKLIDKWAYEKQVFLSRAPHPLLIKFDPSEPLL